MKRAIIISILALLISSCVRETIVLNKGVGGNTSLDLLNRIEKDVIAESPDMVIIMVGTNDMLNSKKMKTYNEFTSNLDEILKRLKSERIDVLLVSPPTADSTYLFERHDKKLFNESPNVKLSKVSSIMKNISSGKENVNFLDINSIFHDLGLPQHNEDEYIRNVRNSERRDGVHLTPKGYSFIAKQIFEFLNKEGKLKKGIKIICFGDSLTFGANVKGKGTTNGESYPAHLHRLIIDN